MNEVANEFEHVRPNVKCLHPCEYYMSVALVNFEFSFRENVDDQCSHFASKPKPINDFSRIWNVWSDERLKNSSCFNKKNRLKCSQNI